MFTKMQQRTPYKANPEAVKELVTECGLSSIGAEVLYARGYRTPNEVQHFLKPSILDLHDPFLMKGMTEVVERLKQATENNETVVVYGDYDADGICATAILAKYLSSKGAQVVPYIPSRMSDGYGVTLAALEKLIEETFPDLILTCDCGISARDEIDAVLDSGVDIIVSDHHEAPDILPNCLCIDPKIADCGYPFDGLCGAGVALKIVEALEGNSSAVLPYLDLATVATVADLVPLIDENRAIVSLGLARMNDGCLNKGLAALLDGIHTVTATDIAYRVAPRINAAGRMGDAYRAFQLLLTDNLSEITSLTASIDADNVLRKESCAKVYAEAIEEIEKKDYSMSYCIVTGHQDWEKGLTSIVAAQLAGEYKCPVFLVVKNGDSLKGTARSVEGVNIYETLKNAEDLLIEYGGHSQAAGFSIEAENVDAFRERVNAYLHEHFCDETFLPNGFFDAVIGEEAMTFNLAKELEHFEPYGNGNPRPIFRVKVNSVKVEPMKAKPAHLVLHLKKVNVNAFNMGRYYSILRNAEHSELNVELSVNRFQGRDYLSAVLKDFDFDRLKIESSEQEKLRASALFALKHCDCIHPTELLDEESLNQILKERRRFGTLYVAYNFEKYEAFVNRYSDSVSRLWHSLFERETSPNFNRIVLAPSPDFDASGYDRIVLLDSGIDASLLPFCVQKEVKIYNCGASDNGMLKNVSCARDVFVKCYRCMLDSGKGANIFRALEHACGQEIPMAQMIACYSVFCSMGLLDYREGEIIAHTENKRDLSQSAAFKKLESML